MSKRSGVQVSNKFATCGRASAVGTCAAGCTRWLNWSAGIDTSEQLVDRSDRPWDNPSRRPSHNDRRRQIARKMLREAFLSDLQTAADQSKIRDRFERLLALAA